MNLIDILEQIEKAMELDSNLSAEVKDKVSELIEVVEDDPTPDNIQALSIVLGKVKDTSKYVALLEKKHY